MKTKDVIKLLNTLQELINLGTHNYAIEQAKEKLRHPALNPRKPKIELVFSSCNDCIRKCPNCQTECDNEDHFCNFCGQAFDWSELGGNEEGRQKSPKGIKK